MMRESIAAAGLSVSLLTLSACSSEAWSEPEPTPSSVPAPEYRLEKDDYARLNDVPANSCASPEALKGDAESCVDMQSAGRVALVNYGLDPDVAQRLAQDTEKLVKAASLGQVTVNITVVAPNMEAREEFSDTVAKNGDCVDADDSSTWLGYMSNLHNSKLDKYDLVMGASVVASCESDDDTVANGAHEPTLGGGRFLEVFDAENILPQNIEPPELEGTPVVTTYDASTAAHELFHAYGLGHSNYLGLNNETGQLSDKLGRKKPVNLLRTMKGAQLEEYGDTDSLMGSLAADVFKADYKNEPYMLNAVQMAALKSADAEAGHAKGLFTELKAAPLKVTSGQIYTVELDTPLTSDDFVIDKDSPITNYGEQVVYDKVVFYAQPYRGEDPNDVAQPTVLEVGLWASSTNDVAQLDTVYQQHSEAQQAYNLGSKTVVVDYTAGGNKLSVHNN